MHTLSHEPELTEIDLEQIAKDKGYEVLDTQPPVEQSTPEPKKAELKPVQDVIYKGVKSPTLFGEFRVSYDSKVTAGYTTFGNPKEVKAPLGSIASKMGFKESGFNNKSLLGLSQGLDYAYYEGVWTNIPSLKRLYSQKTGNTTNFNLNERLRDNNFAILFSGYIKISRNDSYIFSLESDDGSQLWINNQLIVNNDGLHSAKIKSGTISLTKGIYTIKVVYFERAGAQVLNVYYTSSSRYSRTIPIPDSMLFRGDALSLWHNQKYTQALYRTPGQYNLLYPHQAASVKDDYSIVYEDQKKSFFATANSGFVSVRTLLNDNATRAFNVVGISITDSAQVNAAKRWKFQSFYHPFTGVFKEAIEKGGIDGLYDKGLQLDAASFLRNERPLDFMTDYMPSSEVVSEDSIPVEIVDFGQNQTDTGAYSLYNWELFFHTPLLIAQHLKNNQRFEEAQRWYHFIFDPTEKEPWRFNPFTSVNEKSIKELLAIFSNDTNKLEKEGLVKQLERWRKKPFNAHSVAQMRWTSYQKNVVMKYIDNLIAWADQLFRRDSIESINEATQLYVLASEILGSRPIELPARKRARSLTFNELKSERDDFLGRIENYLDTNIIENPAVGDPAPELMTSPFYFCVPKNEKLLKYWDAVEDRLFKIRHCQNIEGVFRQLALFEPAIDPALLARAAAAGLDLNSVLNDTKAAVPHYRFRTMLQKAMELCQDLKSLGSSLLSALEKRDAEEISLIRSSNEIQLLEAVKQLRKRQIDEAKENAKGQKLAKKVTEKRRDYYQDIEKINDNEQINMDKLKRANLYHQIAQGINAGVAFAHLFPNFDVGIAGWSSSPIVKASFGGNNLGSGLQAAASVLEMFSTQHNFEANMASINAGHDRRWNDWKLQEDLANKELKQIEKQISAADIRVELAEKELDNHKIQIENTKVIDNYMHDKFTNKELYDWMVSQLSAVYFQSYQLAFDIAKRAQMAYQFERGSSETYIEFGYWDSLKKGLLSGKKLYHDLKRLEMAHLEQNRREYELTKQISLALVDPIALLRLKETGECYINLREELFDMDNPGHYMRRIKTVNITVPCVTGPYTSVNCTLTLMRNSVRRDTQLPDGIDSYPRTSSDDIIQDDERFVDSVGGIQSIVTSHANNDGGLFEQNLQDERYLPFEGVGAISQWRIQMPKETNQFDFNSIADVVISLGYTAREGGEQIKQAALQNIKHWVSNSGNLTRVISFRQQFADNWQKLFIPLEGEVTHKLTFSDLRQYIPAILGNTTLNINSISFVLGLADETVYPASAAADAPKLSFKLTRNATQVGDVENNIMNLNNLPFKQLPSVNIDAVSILLDGSDWELSILKTTLDALGGIESPLVIGIDNDGENEYHLNPEVVTDGWLVINYVAVIE